MHTSVVNFGGRSARWIFYKKGTVLGFEIVIDGKKKVIKADKVLDLGYKVNEVHVNADKNLVIVSSATGTIYSYNVDYVFGNQPNVYLLIILRAIPC